VHKNEGNRRGANSLALEKTGTNNDFWESDKKYNSRLGDRRHFEHILEEETFVFFDEEKIVKSLGLGNQDSLRITYGCKGGKGEKRPGKIMIRNCAVGKKPLY